MIPTDASGIQPVQFGIGCGLLGTGVYVMVKGPIFVEAGPMSLGWTWAW